MKRTVKAVVAIFLISVFCLTAVPAGARSGKSDEQILLLARAAESLAPSGSYTVLVSISSVFLNRLSDEAYPSTLGAVIADAGVDIGALGGGMPSGRALRAAADALSGFDPTSGALIFCCGFDPHRDPRLIRLETDGWCFY